MISSGVMLVPSIEISKKVVGNTVIEHKVDGLIESIKKGDVMSTSLKKADYFPPLMVSMVKIGEESGGLDFALEKAADFYDMEVDNSLSFLTTMIEPIVILLLAGVVGTIVLSVLLPMMSIYDNIGS
jgi:type IV pilus assembly protein PilC